MYRILTDLR